MSPCCPHSTEDHEVLTACQEVTHYPSEDYPCLCTGFEGTAEKCLHCEHRRSSHTATRVCRPKSGEKCECRRQL